MIKKTVRKFKKKKAIDLNPILASITEIRAQNSVLNLAALPTEYAWLGVYNAALSLFPNNTIGIPQYYSNQVLSDQQLKILGEHIGKLKFDQLIFNGYNTYFSTILQNALQENSSLRTGVIYHGFFAELSGNTTQTIILSAMIEEIKAKRIHKIGFLKQGNSEIFHKLFGIPCHLIVNKNPKRMENIQMQNNIGVLTNPNFRKNTATQVIAALSLKKYSVSIFKTDEYDAFDLEQKLIKWEAMSHEKFLQNLASNLINSHVTFSEASGGQVFTESLALGVPCLTSLTHGYLNDSQELTDALIVKRFDDAWAISEQMESVIANRDHLSKLGLIYSEEMNQKSNHLLKIFLEA